MEQAGGVMPCKMQVKLGKNYVFLWGQSRLHHVFFDMPRAVIGDYKALVELAGAIEEMSNGVISDSKYMGMMATVEPPKVVVVANTVCPVGVLSPDRVLSYRVTKDEIVKQDY